MLNNNDMTPERSKDITNLNDPQVLVSDVLKMRELNPANRMAKFFPTDYFLSQTPAVQAEISKIVIAGLANNDSEIGAYAMATTDYDTFSPVLDPIIQDYHAVTPEFKFQGNWDINGLDLDLKKVDLQLSDVSMRVRVARNVSGWPMTGSMSQDDRVNFENYMVETVFEKMISNPKYGGRYVSLTPGSKYQISDDEYNQLVAEHKMYKDMSADPHLAAAGISGDWPYGRGMYVSADGGSIVWVNEEDHLRIMNMKKGSDLATIFNGLREELDLIESLGVPFARSEKYGYVTSCPSNLGTGMRASLHLALPNLTENGKNTDKLKNILKENKLNVSVRGIGGEHTAAGEGGIVDISPRGRMIPENQVITQLYDAAAKLLSLEKSA